MSDFGRCKEFAAIPPGLAPRFGLPRQEIPFACAQDKPSFVRITVGACSLVFGGSPARA